MLSVKWPALPVPDMFRNSSGFQEDWSMQHENLFTLSLTAKHICTISFNLYCDWQILAGVFVKMVWIQNLIWRYFQILETVSETKNIINNNNIFQKVLPLRELQNLKRDFAVLSTIYTTLASLMNGLVSIYLHSTCTFLLQQTHTFSNTIKLLGGKWKV